MTALRYCSSHPPDHQHQPHHHTQHDTTRNMNITCACTSQFQLALNMCMCIAISTRALLTHCSPSARSLGQALAMVRRPAELNVLV